MPQYSSYNIIKDLYYNNVNFENLSTIEQEILAKYTNTESIESNEKYIELPDILTNVNGVHTYKLISSKDIDWENIYLPNSSVSELNWGSFDKERRWNNDSPIHINDVYELMNIIDYLLCSCADLWSEINKLKYGNGNDTEIWFVKDVYGEILKSNELSKNDFKKGNDKDIQITYFNPTQNYTLLNIPDFGISTQFNTETPTEYPIRRLILKYGNKNGVLGLTKEEQTNYVTAKTQSTTLNGQVINIFAYKITNEENNNEIKFFPGFNFDNFINKAKTANDVVDNINKKLKYNNIYFKSSREANIYERVYCEFLINDNYILYYKDTSSSNLVKKVIYKSSNSIDLSPYNEYSNANITEGYFYNIDSINYPYLFICDDEFSLDLYIETPKIENKYEKADKTITLYYYKDENDININIYTNNNTSNIIDKTEDLTQASSLLNDKTRYNIPDNTPVTIDVNAKWLNIVTDDEYLDYPVSIEDALNNYSSYYTYSHVDNTGKRIFTQLDYDEMVNWTNESSNKFTDLTLQTVVQLYVKNEHPYELTYNLSPNQLILQDNYASVKEEINNIKSHINTVTDSNHTYINLNYPLSNDFEQLKFNIDLEIEETSKVKGITYTLPINLNKVHNPKLHYINWKDTYHEYMSYFDYDVFALDDTYCNFISNNPNSHKMYNAMNKFSLSSYVINNLYNVNNTYEFNDNQLSSNDTNVLIFSYHPQQSYVNILGSNFTTSYIAYKYKKTESSILANNTVSIFYSEEDLTYNTVKQEKNQSLFNIYDLGKNYRFEGSNNQHAPGSGRNTLYDDASTGKLKYNINANRVNISNDSENEDRNPLSNNICYFLNYKLSSNLFVTDFYNYNLTRYQNNNEYFDNDIYNINTPLMNIYKTSYITIYPQHYQRSNRAFVSIPISVPIMYFDLLSSSFHPTSEHMPLNNTTHEFNLNNINDIERYKNYVNMWNNDNYYDTITLKLQLKENLHRGIPFFYETNEATLNFKVKRCNNLTILTSPNFEGKHHYTKLFLGQKYYLSNLIQALTGKPNENSRETISLGSYPKWNSEIENYEIIDIYKQTDNYINYDPNRGYQYIDFIHKINNEYDYNIEKIAELNKFKISSIRIDNDDILQLSGNNYIISPDYPCIDIDPDLYTLSLNDEDIVNLLSINIDSYNNISNEYKTNILNPITIVIKTQNPIYGNLRYDGTSTTTEGAIVTFTPIHRIKNNNYEVITTSSGTYTNEDSSFITIELPLNDTTIELELFMYDETKTYYYKPTEIIDNDNDFTEITGYNNSNVYSEATKQSRIIDFFEKNNLYVKQN